MLLFNCQSIDCICLTERSLIETCALECVTLHHMFLN